MTPRFFRLLDSVTLAFRRFPLVALASLLATGTALYSHHSESSSVHEQCLRLILTLILSLPLFVTASYISELHQRSRWVTHLGSIVLVLAAWFFIPLKMEPAFVWYRYWMLLLMAAALFGLVPGINQKGSANWWRMNVSLMNALVLAFIMTGIVLIGLQLACFSADKLFQLHLEKTYQDLFFFCSLSVFPLGVIALLPPATGELDVSQPGFAIWGNLCKWILLPLGFLFITILGLYAVQIIIQWKLPDGMIATPVISLGVYGTGAMLLLQPWRDSHSWARWFSRIYPSAFLILSILLFISLSKRIGTYGFTFDRYFALAAGIWFFLSALLFLFDVKKTPVFVSLLLLVIASLAALGPLSAGTVSLQSQSVRLTRYLSTLHAQGKQKDAEQISSILRFLSENYGVEVVERFTGPLHLDKDVNSWKLSQKAMEHLGVHDLNDKGEEMVDFERPEGRPIPTEGARFSFPRRKYNDSEILLGKSPAGEEVKIQWVSDKIKLLVGSKVMQTIDFKEVKIPESGKVEEIAPVVMKWDQRTFDLHLLAGIYRRDASGKKTLSSIGDCIVFEK
jgi:hypothetical protein